MRAIAGAGVAIGLTAVAWLDGLLWASLLPRATPTPPVPAGLVDLSAEGCAGCHPAQAAEWRGSRMGQSWRSAPFQAGWAHEDHLPYCLDCHAPLEAQQPLLVDGVWWPLPLVLASSVNPAFDPELQAEGVTCAACHVLPDGVIGASRPMNAPHATRVAAPTPCARCHQTPAVALHPLARPLFDTVGENERWRASTGSTADCVDCHAPQVVRADGKLGRSHRFLGGWDPNTLSSAVSLSPVHREGDVWSVDVVNRCGHGLPTGEASRAVVVRLVGLDAAGAEVAASETWFARRIAGPPFRDVGDTTLAGGEGRTVRATFPAGSAIHSVRAEVHLRRYALAPHLSDAADPGDRDVRMAEAP